MVQDDHISIREEDLETVYTRLSDIDGNRADNINPLVLGARNSSLNQLQNAYISLYIILCPA
jgi:hypothetical protein